MERGGTPPIGKDKFCLTVTGRTLEQLRQSVWDEHGTPTDQRRQKIGRDMPRSEGETAWDLYATFMARPLRKVHLLGMSKDELMLAYREFREFEERVHPRDTSPTHEAYWGPTYEMMERANVEGDEEAIRRGIQEMIDQLIDD